MSQDVQDREARFSYLLNPIRDLSKNWDVDIACLLEEYLAELEMVTISFDGGKTTLNFAEAALVIQGSAAVYSKKVDYLYNLVQQMLNLIHSQKKRQNKNGDKEKAGDLDDFDEFGSVEDLPIATNIDMKEEVCTLEFIPKIPFDLIPLDANERGTQLIYDAKNRLLGHKMDFFSHSLYPDNSGTLVLSSPLFALEVENLRLDSEGSDFDPFPAPWDESLHDNNTFLDGISDNDIVPNVDVPLRCDDSGHGIRIDADESYEDLLIHASEEDKKTSLAREKAKKLLCPLNPHEASKETERPPRRGKTLSVLKPETATKGSRRGKRRCLENGKRPLTKISEYCNQAFYSHDSKLPKEPFENPLSSLNDLRYEEYVRRKSLLKEMFSQNTPDNPGLKSDTDDDASDCGDFGIVGGEGGCGDGLGSDVEDNAENMLMNRTEFRYQDIRGDEYGDPSFTELLLKHLAYQREQAHLRVKTSDMMVRVRRWEEKLSSVLEDEDSQTHFDVHEYCNKVLSRFRTTSTISFADVLVGTQDTEISRYFLATLHLANTYDVKIQPSESSVLLTTQLELTRSST